MHAIVGPACIVLTSNAKHSYNKGNEDFENYYQHGGLFPHLSLSLLALLQKVCRGFVHLDINMKHLSFAQNFARGLRWVLRSR